MSVAEIKADLRREVLATREEISSTDRRCLSARIFDEVLALPDYEAAGTVLAYSGFGSEPLTEGFLRSVLKSGKTLVLPRIEERRLALHEVRDLEGDLVPGVWGIREPDARLPRVEPSAVEFILVPGVAFDKRGGRLGYGGGYYDTLLGGLRERPLLVAGAFEIQVVEEVPTTPRDVRMDLLVTERGVHGVSRKG